MAITTLLHDMGATGYLLDMDVWQPIDSLIDKLAKGEVSISELPLDDKEDGIMVLSVEKGKPARSFLAKVDYERGWIGEFQPFIEDESYTMEGRFVIRNW